VLGEELEDVEDDEETDEDVVVVGRSPLTIVPTDPPEVYRRDFSTLPRVDMMKLTVVAEVEDNEDGEEDEEDEVALAAAVSADADCVVSIPLMVGLAPAPMTGWGLEPPGASWGIGARFFRKRLWLTW
jgi:hypothetical protein